LDQADEWIATHGATVWRTVTRLLGSRDRDAEDCFQDAFVELWQVSRAEPIDHVRALLIRIATRRAIDVIRRREVGRRRFPRSVDDFDSSKDREPSSNVAGDELATALVEALIDLPESQAAVFCMTQLDGVDHSEVARALNKSNNHVAVLLKRARTQLQAKLARFAQPHGRKQPSSARSL